MMDMPTRNQYLQTLIETHKYHTASKKEKSKLLDEYCINTGQKRKYVIWKIRNRTYVERERSRQRKRTQYYDGFVTSALARCWEIFDFPCGQRLAPLLKTEMARLRALGELSCSDKVAEKLEKIGFRTIDEKLKHTKEVKRQKGKYHKKQHPLLYQKIPVKVFSEQDREKEGNVQIDLVEHCGQSASGEFMYTLAGTDIATGWWEGEAVMERAQERVFEGLKERGKIKRKYDIPQTPYERVIQSKDISENTKRELTRIYYSLNPAQLKRDIDAKLRLLYCVKHQSQKVETKKKLQPRMVTFLIAQPTTVSVTYRQTT